MTTGQGHPPRAGQVEGCCHMETHGSIPRTRKRVKANSDVISGRGHLGPSYGAPAIGPILGHAVGEARAGRRGPGGRRRDAAPRRCPLLAGFPPRAGPHRHEQRLGGAALTQVGTAPASREDATPGRLRLTTCGTCQCPKLRRTIRLCPVRLPLPGAKRAPQSSAGAPPAGWVFPAPGPPGSGCWPPPRLGPPSRSGG